MLLITMFQFLQILILSEIAPLVLSLSMSHFEVPEFAQYGKRVVLKCHYQLSEMSDGTLESVKWYKVMAGGRDWVNFYTYYPARVERQRKQTRHKLKGINVLMSRSNDMQVVLKKVQISSSGSYKCEVTTKRDRRYNEGPPFDTVSEVGKMQVVELPNEPPEISGGGSNYAYGDELDLNCTSKPSYPPTKLTWYVNNEVANSRTSNVEETLSKTAEQLYYSESRLTMKINSRQFYYGEMKLKCVASLIDEPIEADKSSENDVMVLKVNKLPEAMKYQYALENIFDVPVTGNARKNKISLCFSVLLPIIYYVLIK